MLWVNQSQWGKALTPCEQANERSALLVVDGNAEPPLQCLDGRRGREFLDAWWTVAGVDFEPSAVEPFPRVLRRAHRDEAAREQRSGIQRGAVRLVHRRIADVFVDRDVPPRTVINSSRQKPDFRIPDRFFDKALGQQKK